MKRNFSDEERARLVTNCDNARDGLAQAETSHGYAKDWHKQVTDRYAEQVTDQDRDRIRPELAESADRLRGAQDALRDATKQFDDAENTLSTFDRDRRKDLLVAAGTEGAKMAGKAGLEQYVGAQLPDIPPEVAYPLKYQIERIMKEQVKPWAEENLKVSSKEELDRMVKETSGSLDTPQNQVLRDIEREVPTSGELEPPAFPKPSEAVQASPSQPGEPESPQQSQSKFAQIPPPQDDVPQQSSAGQSASKFTHVPPPSDTVAPASSPAPEGPSASKFTHVPVQEM